MKPLNKIISRYLYRITFILIALILVFLAVIQILTEQYRAVDDSHRTFQQIEQVLTDKSLKLVQEITPNTAEKNMQYSAIWSESGEYIVQVGMEPVNVLNVTEKNKLSYIFSLFRVNPDMKLKLNKSTTREEIHGLFFAFSGLPELYFLYK